MTDPQRADDMVVHRYCRASESGDLDQLAGLLAPEVRLVSPLSGRMVFRGRHDVAAVLAAVHAVLSDVRWTLEVVDGQHQVAVGEARVCGMRLTDAMVLEIGADGRVAVVRPHLRPLLPVTVFAVRLGVRLLRHPRVLRRALGTPGPVTAA